MISPESASWLDELGVGGWAPPKFFRNAAQVDATHPPPTQSHALRTAFKRLGLDGIVCLQNSPAIYFKEITKAESQAAQTLHRLFWNQGLAPILVLIDPDEIHIYSGLSLPESTVQDPDPSTRLVQKLNRVREAAEVRRFVLSVESGEYFHQHSKSFDPKQRVDRELLRNLSATRDALARASGESPNQKLLDALLCRIVFVCYLFDREVVEPDYLRICGIPNCSHLRDVFGLLNAQEHLYSLFNQLGVDFNGDLFNYGLAEEYEYVDSSHMAILSRFLHGTDVLTGQPRFWPYEFGIIPIETISAIYERFLKADDASAKKQSGAFYTPRFLAEVTLDIALEGVGSLLDKRFLDPACGSGIFLVGLFNRIAEEWKRKHPTAGYDKRASALIKVLRDRLFGIDVNPTACRIAAFSLYLAFLDQLSPPAIKVLQKKGKLLPLLVCPEDREHACDEDGHTIKCADFFDEDVVEHSFDVIIGNPPWASVTGPSTSAENWCDRKSFPMANRQLAIAFLWKAALHQSNNGRICFILPAMLMFNHQDTAIAVQRQFLENYAVDVVLNLADMRFNLFSEATGPALIVRYRAEKPSAEHRVKYLVPKTSWSISQAEIVTILPEDRTEFRLAEAIADVRRGRPPLAFKERYWGTPRDWKLLDRLLSIPPLSTIVAQTRERGAKRWVMAEGFKRSLDGTENPIDRPWPDSHPFLPSQAKNVSLFVLPSDCEEIGDRYKTFHRTVSATQIFKRPHVLVWYGMRVAFADFDVLFKHAIRGIHGPDEDRGLLMFLAAFLNSSLARYFLFHTSANWGIERSKVHLEEVLRVPFPLPHKSKSARHSLSIVKEVERLMTSVMQCQTDRILTNRAAEVAVLQKGLNELIYRYFDLDTQEIALVEDTNEISIKSILPSKASAKVPAIAETSPESRRIYTDTLCATLNEWASGGPYYLQAGVHLSPTSGVAAVALHRHKNFSDGSEYTEQEDLVQVMDHLQRTFAMEMAAVEIVRGVKIIDGNSIYILKPLGQRFWTRTAALNDADEIAATILGRSQKEGN